MTTERSSAVAMNAPVPNDYLTLTNLKNANLVDGANSYT